MRSKLLWALLPALLLVSSVGFAACGDDDEEEGGTVSGALEEFAPVTEPSDDSEKGGTLTVIASGDVDYMDPGPAYYQFTYMISNATHRTLVAWPPDENEEPQPDLAEEEPEISDDGKTITFTIQEGIKFSPPVDREVTSADIEYAIERGMMPGVATGYHSAYLGDLDGYDEAVKAVEDDPKTAPDISGIETPDDRTLVLRLTRPTAAAVVQALSLPVSAPVPEEYAKEFDSQSPSTYGNNVVFTGPYMVENNAEGELTGYSPGKEIVLVRNPNWDPETDYRPAYLDRIEVQEGFEDVTSAYRRILQGDSQVTGDQLPTAESLKLAAQEFPDQLTLTPSGGSRYVALNTTIPPFDDVNVRKAVLAAADREALRLARGGELIGPIATHFIPPLIPGHEEAGGLEGPDNDFLANPDGDPDLAADYMRKAGYESGQYDGDAKLLMVGENAGVDKKQSEVALDVFEQLGFEIDFRQVNGDVMYTRFCNVPKAEVAICPTVGWLKDFLDPQSILDPTFNGENIVPTNNSNWSQLDVPEINDAITDAQLITDPEERAEAWGEIDRMITEQAPAIPIIWDNQPNAASANVNMVINLFNAQTDLSHTSIQP